MFVTLFPRHLSFFVLFQDQRCSTQISNHLANTYTLSDSCIRLSYKLNGSVQRWIRETARTIPSIRCLEGLAIQIREKGVGLNVRS